MTESEKINIIKKAIAENRSITLKYQGNARIFNPTIIGMGKTRGVNVFGIIPDAFTLKGDRLYYLDRMEEIEIGEPQKEKPFRKSAYVKATYFSEVYLEQ